MVTVLALLLIVISIFLFKLGLDVLLTPKDEWEEIRREYKEEKKNNVWKK